MIHRIESSGWSYTECEGKNRPSRSSLRVSLRLSAADELRFGRIGNDREKASKRERAETGSGFPGPLNHASDAHAAEGLATLIAIFARS